MASIATQAAPAVQPPRTSTDFAGLAALRAQAGKDADPATTREAARQFEALFVQMMLQSMRQAGDIFSDGSDTTYRDMFDQQIALEMTRGKGLGLAELLTRQMSPTQNVPAELRAPHDGDFIAARQAAEPSMPLARFRFAAPDSADLLASATLPAFEVAETGAGPAARPWNDWKPATPEDFIRDVWPLAENAGRELGVDPRAIVAQAALETGWGRHITRDSQGVSGNNLFNIKADRRWGGERVAVRTLEFEGGLPRQTVAAFRAYPDLKSAFSDYVNFLRGNPRYTEALQHGAHAGKFVDSLQAAGYATDPDYAGKLRSIMDSPRFSDLVGSLKNLARMPKP